MVDDANGRLGPLGIAKAEARAWIGPPARALAGGGRVLLNRIDAARGRPATREEPVAHQWKRILRNSGAAERALFEAPDGADMPRPLIAAGYGLSGAKLAFETILAAVLRLRGCAPRVMLCDAAVPACEFNPYGSHEPRPEFAPPLGPKARRAMCDRCRGDIRSAFEPLGMPEVSMPDYERDTDVERISAIVGAVPYEDYRAFTYNGIGVGEHAFASMLRATLRGTLLDDAPTRALFRRYLLSASLYVDLLERMFEVEQPSHVIEVHGVYLIHGVLAEVARKHRVPVVVWGFPYRQGTVWLSHDDTYHRTMVTDPVDRWVDYELDEAEAQELDAYLDSKRGGGRDYISYHPKAMEDRAAIVRELNLDPSKPIISAFTNVIWDAQIYYDFNAFDNMLDWIYTTIEHMGTRPDIQLVIRAHPAEVKGGMPTAQPIVPEINARFPVLPSNVRIIPPESDISSYTIAEMSAATLIYGTKMGLEIAVRGIPVVVAGETFNRGKGFTYDIETREEYLELLDRVEHLPPNSDGMVERARRYAFYLFYRRMIDFTLLQVAEPHRSIGVRLAFDELADLLPGRDAGLDAICEGILERVPFEAKTRAAAGAAT